LDWACLKARFPLPELTGDRFPLPVNTGRVDGRAFPLAVLTGRAKNRLLIRAYRRSSGRSIIKLVIITEMYVYFPHKMYPL